MFSTIACQISELSLKILQLGLEQSVLSFVKYKAEILGLGSYWIELS